MKIDDHLIKIREMLKNEANPIQIGEEINKLYRMGICFGCIAFRVMMPLDDVLNYANQATYIPELSIAQNI